MANLLLYQLKIFFFYKSVMSSIFFSSLVTMISIALMHKNIDIKILTSLLVIIPLLALTNQIEQIFCDEQISGKLEFILVTHESCAIIGVKTLSLFLVAIITVFTNILCCFLLFNLDLQFCLQIMLATIPVCLIASIMVTLIGIIRVYFERNSNILSALIFPFLIPVLILYGLYFESSNSVYLYLSTGIALIFSTIGFYLIVVLLKELYNN